MANKAKTQSPNSAIALAIVSCVISLIILFTVGKTVLTKIQHNSRVIGKQQVAEKQLKQNLANLPQLADAYRNLGANLQRIDHGLPETAAFPELVASMESLSNTSGVGLQTVAPLVQATGGSQASPVAATTTTPGAAAGEGSPQPFLFNISVIGNYGKMLQLLKNLELSSRPIKVTGMQLSGTTDAMTATINATTFYYTPTVLTDQYEAVK